MSHRSHLTGVHGTSWARLLIFVSYCFWLFTIPSAIYSTNPETLLCARPCAGLSGRESWPRPVDIWTGSFSIAGDLVYVGCLLALLASPHSRPVASSP